MHSVWYICILLHGSGVTLSPISKSQKHMMHSFGAVNTSGSYSRTTRLRLRLLMRSIWALRALAYLYIAMSAIGIKMMTTIVQNRTLTADQQPMIMAISKLTRLMEPSSLQAFDTAKYRLRLWSVQEP